MPKMRDLPPEVRRERLSSFVDQHVTVEVSANGNANVLTGKVLSVALPNVAVADLLIVRPDHPTPGKRYLYDQAISAATIDRIERTTSEDRSA